MKKLVNIGAICLSALLPTLTLSSCFLSSSNNEEHSAVVKIIYPDSEEEQEFTYRYEETVTPKEYVGKYLVGYYAQNSANGKEYINFKGETNGEWLKNYPTTIYAVYETLTYNEKHTSPIFREESPHSFYGAGTTWKTLDQIAETDDFYKVLYWNTSLDVEITMHLDLKLEGSTVTGTTSVKYGLGSETLITQDVSIYNNRYVTATVSKTVKAMQILKSNIWLTLSSQPGTLDNHGLVKNFYYTYSLVNR